MKDNTLRRKTYDFLELGSFGSRWALFFEAFMVALIVANVVAVALETVPSLLQNFHPYFQAFDRVSLGVFIVEYLARVWASAERELVAGDTAIQRRLRYMVSPLALLDLIVILPVFIAPLLNVDLRELRIFRLLRLLKLVRYSPALASLGRVIMAEQRALFATMIVMASLLFFSSTLMYYIEGGMQPAKFGSIPDAFWWALATLTTVGYGDVVPITGLGKLVAGVIMVIGLGFYALPIGIIASGFSDEVHRREFLVPVSLVEDIPLFSRLPRQAAVELSARLRSLSLRPGTILTHRMDRDNGLYFIISGEMDAFFRHQAIPFRTGDFFGECGLLNLIGDQPATVAKSRVRVLWLESTDLHVLLSLYPEFARQVQEHCARRLGEFCREGLLEESVVEDMRGHQAEWMRAAQMPVMAGKQ
ncbi:cyclic nucleotide-gated ion channel [Kordiimonas sp.]|uniref:cyclic nucleotide-gated ion channel n=1 Tax=Kordiimonas sp. TaxID=1970157 RepID=UPI003A949C6C